MNEIINTLTDLQNTLDAFLGDTDPYIPFDDGEEWTEVEMQDYIRKEEPIMYSHQKLIEVIPKVKKLISGLEAIIEAGRMNENSRVQYMVEIARNTLKENK